MKKILPFLATLLVLSGCYSVETTSRYNKSFTWAHSQSEPVYLSFKDTKKSSFYFILNRDTNHTDYKLQLRWHGPQNGDLLFNGYDSTLKFFINNEKILTFHPIKRPKVVAYNLNSNGHEEEALFSLTKDEFFTIAYGKEVSAEVTGRYVSVVGYFTRRNSLKAFRDFAENSH